MPDFRSEAELIAAVSSLSTTYHFRRLDNFWLLEYEFGSRPKWLCGASTRWMCHMELWFVKIGLALFAVNILFNAKGRTP